MYLLAFFFHLRKKSRKACSLLFCFYSSPLPTRNDPQFLRTAVSLSDSVSVTEPVGRRLSFAVIRAGEGLRGPAGRLSRRSMAPRSLPALCLPTPLSVSNPSPCFFLLPSSFCLPWSGILRSLSSCPCRRKQQP